jgi:hypothetical protein
MMTVRRSLRDLPGRRAAAQIADQDACTKGDPMNLQARIDTLKDRHANLEARLASEDRRPAPDSETMGLLKREKLRLKEEMARLAASGEH